MSGFIINGNKKPYIKIQDASEFNSLNPTENGLYLVVDAFGITVDGVVDTHTNAMYYYDLNTNKWIKISERESLDLDLSIYEQLSQKQNSLDIDGKGKKYPTVDIINEAIDILNEKITKKQTIAITEVEQYFSGYSYTTENMLNNLISLHIDGILLNENIDYEIQENTINLIYPVTNKILTIKYN